MARIPSAAVAPRGAPREVARALPSAEAIDTHVGRRIRTRRIALGISQGTLGRHLGLTFSQVQKYEKGANRIGAGRLYHVAALLGVPVQYFFEALDETAVAEPAHTLARASSARSFQEALEGIADPQARQALLTLAQSMAKEVQHEDAQQNSNP
jgi:transcriptional regulator with XRE-family HTH domain